VLLSSLGLLWTGVAWASRGDDALEIAGGSNPGVATSLQAIPRG
jgi:hypothetical protein